MYMGKTCSCVFGTDSPAVDLELFRFRRGAEKRNFVIEVVPFKEYDVACEKENVIKIYSEALLRVL